MTKGDTRRSIHRYHRTYIIGRHRRQCLRQAGSICRLRLHSRIPAKEEEWFRQRNTPRNQKLELAVGKTVKLYHADNSKGQNTTNLIDELKEKRIQLTTTFTFTSQQNANAELRFGTLFAVTRASLEGSGLYKTFWSLSCLYAIRKANFIPVKCLSGKKAFIQAILGKNWNQDHFLSFGQPEYIMDNNPNKKLDDKAIKSRYFREMSKHQYLLLITSSKKTQLVRQKKKLQNSKWNKAAANEQDDQQTEEDQRYKTKASAGQQKNSQE